MASLKTKIKEDNSGIRKEGEISESPSAKRFKSSYRDELDIKLCEEAASCSCCALKLDAWDGILLQMCLHVFCRDCLQTQVEKSDGTQILCPFRGETQCSGFLLNREIKAIQCVSWTLTFCTLCYRLTRWPHGKCIPNTWRNHLISLLEESLMYTPCKYKGCTAKFSVDTEKNQKVFLCSVCNSVNCITCQAIHDDLQCGQYQQLMYEATAAGISLTSVEFKKMMDRERNEGFHHLQDIIVEQLLSPTAQGRNGNSYSDAVQIMENMDIITTSKEFECVICYDEDVKEGIILRECLHKFCKNCLQRVVENSEEAEIHCPFENCQFFILPREIKAIVPSDLYEAFLNRSMKLAESLMTDTFHCLTADCSGFCILEETANIFLCPVCNMQNCLRCKVIHNHLSCQEYRDQLADDKNRQVQLQNERKGEKKVEKLISNKTYMRCPHCKMVCQKISGCDHVICGKCRRHFNWKGKN